MLTLSNFKIEFLTVAKWIGIALFALIGLFILIKILFFIKELISPTPPPPATVSFGKLPKPFFPEGIKKKFTYAIDTISGDLPTFPDRNNVYEMEKPGRDILAVQRASERAQGLGFNPRPEHLSDVLYRWTNPSPPVKTLVLNVNIASFNLYSSYLSDPFVLSGANLPTEQGAVGMAQSFLQALDLYFEDLDPEKTKTQLLSIENGTIIPVTKISRAKLINVYFFQKNIDELPIVYPTGKTSVMNLLVAGGEGSPQIVSGRFFYQKVTDKSSTYPIITAQQAYEELKKGNAYIASHSGGDLNVLIKKVYVGFYAQGRSQDYLTPVIVFEGNNDFLAYVRAIKDEWIEN